MRFTIAQGTPRQAKRQEEIPTLRVGRFLYLLIMVSGGASRDAKDKRLYSYA